MEIGAFEAELGSAIALLEDAKLHLLEVFRWGSKAGMVTPEDRRARAMQIALVQTMLPLLDTHLSRSFQMITGNPLPSVVMVARDAEITFPQRKK